MRRLGFWIKFVAIVGVSAVAIIEVLSDNRKHTTSNNNHYATPNNKQGEL